MKKLIILIIFAITFSEASRRLKYEYLNPEKVMVTKTDLNGIEILCYDIGMFWVCPNPNDSYRSKDIKEQYNDGMFINRIEKTISYKDFNNSEFWNS